jgi:hypothetical protein
VTLGQVSSVSPANSHSADCSLLIYLSSRPDTLATVSSGRSLARPQETNKKCVLEFGSRDVINLARICENHPLIVIKIFFRAVEKVAHHIIDGLYTADPVGRRFKAMQSIYTALNLVYVMARICLYKCFGGYLFLCGKQTDSMTHVTFQLCYNTIINNLYSLFVCLTTWSVSRIYNVNNRMVNEYGAVSETRIDRGNRNTRRSPAPVPF